MSDPAYFQATDTLFNSIDQYPKHETEDIMNLILLELILVTGIALGLGFWQLYDVNKALKEEQEKDQDKRLQHDENVPERPAQVHDDTGEDGHHRA